MYLNISTNSRCLPTNIFSSRDLKQHESLFPKLDRKSFFYPSGTSDFNPAFNVFLPTFDVSCFHEIVNSIVNVSLFPKHISIFFVPLAEF